MDFPNKKEIIGGYLSKIYPQFTPAEKINFDKLNEMMLQNKTFETFDMILSMMLHIIIIVEEDSVPSGQEVGKFAQGVIDLLPSDYHALYREFVKQTRLDIKLRQTFKGFAAQVNKMFPTTV
jgi:hypothetical protein